MTPGLKDKARELAATVRLALQVGWKTGMLPHVLPRGLGVLSGTLLGQRSDPSTLYRLQAVIQPDKVALQWRHRTYTFAQMHDEIARMASGLRACGVAPGDSVLLMLKNRPEFIFAQPAMSRMGAAGVSISWRSTPHELAYAARHSRAQALLFDAEVADTVRQAASECGMPRHRMFSVSGASRGFPSYELLLSTRNDPGPAAADHAAVIVYTSGTTGRPKAAVRKFPRDVVQGTLNLLKAAPLRTDDVHLAVLPFYHSTAFAFTSFSHLVGAKVVILDEFTPEGFLSAVQGHRITQTAVVPTLLHRVCKLGDAVVRSYDTSSLRAIITAGAPLSGPLAVQVMDLLGDVLYNFYGATETGLNTVATPADLRRAPGTIGRLVPGNEIRLLDERGEPVPQGEVGELYARSGLMVSGYLGDEEATRASQRDGFFSVGDLARVDEHGCYHLVGRKRDMIISGGVNVYPAEVEAVLEAHPAVAEAAVVGVADEEWGERVRAFVVLREGPPGGQEAAQLEAFCRERLMGPKRPRDYILLESLPRNPTGKVLKNELRAR
jgi:fatty-acyl-CoA synthase